VRVRDKKERGKLNERGRKRRTKKERDEKETETGGRKGERR